jgi:uncharacterized protein (TIGR00369 family)
MTSAPLPDDGSDQNADNPFRALLGIQVTEFGAGTATVTIDPVSPLLRQARGIVHGGVYATLVDCAAGEALATVMRADDEGYTVDLNVTYLRPVVDLALVAHGRTVRCGRTVGVAVADILDGSGALVATGRATFALRSRAERLRPSRGAEAPPHTHPREPEATLGGLPAGNQK